MAKMREDSACKVRELIFAYESQNGALEPPAFQGRKRAKSIGNALSYKLFREPDLDIHSMVDIEKELVRIEAHLNYYELYEKETHVAFQEQLFNLLTTIVNIDPEDHEGVISKKKTLIGETQKLARILNAKLPFGADYDGCTKMLKRSYSSPVRKEEAVVSTTSYNSYLPTSQTIIGGTFKPEVSLNFKKETDVAEKPISKELDEAIVEENSGYLPSVSKLKKFFSFRRDDRAKVDVPVTYPAISRSQSLNVKSEKSVIIKKHDYETLDENEEKRQSINLLNKSVTDIDSKGVDLIENKEVTSEKGVYHNISVSKLKSMFEDTKSEIDEGNYMNFTGLLRNFDVKKKVDLTKSKSTSDLKSQLEEISLFNEIDEDEDVQVSIDVDKQICEIEINNNSVENKTHGSNNVSENQKENDQNSDEVYISGKVQTLKENFERLSHIKNENSPKNKADNTNYIPHRTIGSDGNNTDYKNEPTLKVPSQLRTGWANHSCYEDSSDDSCSPQSQQISSTSKVSAAYFEKTSAQNTSFTERSPNLVSSSSHSSYAQDYRSSEFDLHTSFISPTSEFEGILTNTETDEPDLIKEKIDVKLTDSQEQLLDDLIEDADSLHSYEDDFKELVDQYK